MTDLHNFNAGRKSWKMYAKELTSISGDDLTLTPYDGKDLILEVSGNGNILFKENGITYNLEDLSNVANNSSGSGDYITRSDFDTSLNLYALSGDYITRSALEASLNLYALSGDYITRSDLDTSLNLNALSGDYITRSDLAPNSPPASIVGAMQVAAVTWVSGVAYDIASDTSHNFYRPQDSWIPASAISTYPGTGYSLNAAGTVLTFPTSAPNAGSNTINWSGSITGITVKMNMNVNGIWYGFSADGNTWLNGWTPGTLASTTATGQIFGSAGGVSGSGAPSNMSAMRYFYIGFNVGGISAGAYVENMEIHRHIEPHISVNIVKIFTKLEFY